MPNFNIMINISYLAKPFSKLEIITSFPKLIFELHTFVDLRRKQDDSAIFFQKNRNDYTDLFILTGLNMVR